jgi:hypothetical protein
VNISRNGKRLRAIAGYTSLVIAAVIFSLMVLQGPDVHWVWQTPAIVPLFIGFIGLLEARRET